MYVGMDLSHYINECMHIPVILSSCGVCVCVCVDMYGMHVYICKCMYIVVCDFLHSMRVWLSVLCITSMKSAG